MDLGRMRGNLSVVLLKIIADEGPLYGLEIAREVEGRTQGDFKVTAGGLYPALRRLEKKGWVDVNMRRPLQGGGPVSYYTITAVGRDALASEREETRVFLRRLSAALRL